MGQSRVAPIIAYEIQDRWSMPHADSHTAKSTR